MINQPIYFKPSKVQAVIRWVLAMITYFMFAVLIFYFVLERDFSFLLINTILYMFFMGLFVAYIYKNCAIKIYPNKVVGIDGWLRTTTIPLEKIDKEKTRKLFRFKKILSGGQIVSVDGSKIFVNGFFTQTSINEIFRVLDALQFAKERRTSS